MIAWYRVPTGIARALDGSTVATREQAVADLLGRWHLGAPTNDRELRKAWRWSHERVARLVAEMTAWAAENGGAGPSAPAVDPRDAEIDHLRARLAELESATKRPTKIDHGPTTDQPTTDHSNTVATPESLDTPTSDRPATDQRPTTTRAGLPSRETGEFMKGDLAREPRPETPQAPRTPGGIVHPSDDDPPPVRVGDREIPGDLPALLFGVRSGHRDAIAALLNAGIPDTRALLRLTADERKHTPGMGAPLWHAIGDRLRDQWGVEPGCLAVASAPDPPPPKPIPKPPAIPHGAPQQPGENDVHYHIRRKRESRRDP